MIEEQKRTIVRNIRRLLKENNMTQSELADKIEIAKSTMSDYMNYRAKPSSGVLEKMSLVFGVSKSDIDTTYKDLAVELIDGELKYVTKHQPVSFVSENNNNNKIRIIGKIAAGTPIEAIEDIVDEVYPAYNVPNSSDIFGLLVHGESMNKIVPSGNYAILRKQSEVENGDIAAVIVNGNYATLKRVYKFTDLIVLEPCSYDESYSDQKYTKENCDDIKIIGKYLYSVSPIMQ
ncbi:LexA family transcriptional regulator [Bacillus sp. FJAT-49736]|uniref:LexA family protein n=1 Tax=Bacillus sp. FJAT-49736 TaxID=2833582 RepID=UPI001BC9271A|nr:LexA family transcriptional regulator [Bacillus sp. FJAT-49736]MBS4171906.1 helix-turn-helix domain-containing protein [Bacillus sp. FJAT-49736]